MYEDCQIPLINLSNSIFWVLSLNILFASSALIGKFYYNKNKDYLANEDFLASVNVVTYIDM